MTEQLAFDLVPAVGAAIRPRSLGAEIQAIYETRSEADFVHMERRVAELEATLGPGEQIPETDQKGYFLALTLLALRAMERSERDIAGDLGVGGAAEIARAASGASQ